MVENPNYLECNLEDHSSKATQAKSTQDPTATNGWVPWHSPVVPPMWGSTDRRTTVQAGPVKNMRPYLKINQHKKSWWSGSNGTAHAC
jgi:hypothetical protein